MNRLSSRVLIVLLTLLMVFSIVACKEEVQPQATTFVVTFDTDEGSAIAPVTVAEGGKVKQPEDPTKEGLIFGGWWTKTNKGNFKSKYVFSKQVTSDLTLYARWYTTKYYMPAGWAGTVETPMWTSKDADTVTVPNAVLEGDFKKEVTNVTDGLKEAQIGRAHV